MAFFIHKKRDFFSRIDKQAQLKEMQETLRKKEIEKIRRNLEKDPGIQRMNFE